MDARAGQKNLAWDTQGGEKSRRQVISLLFPRNRSCCPNSKYSRSLIASSLIQESSVLELYFIENFFTLKFNEWIFLSYWTMCIMYFIPLHLVFDHLRFSVLDIGHDHDGIMMDLCWKHFIFIQNTVAEDEEWGGNTDDLILIVRMSLVQKVKQWSLLTRLLFYLLSSSDNWHKIINQKPTSISL